MPGKHHQRVAVCQLRLAETDLGHLVVNGEHPAILAADKARSLRAKPVSAGRFAPGPVGVNMATYVGFETAGVLGAIVATLGLVFPSIVIILVIAGFLKAFRNNKFVDAAFYGLRPASTAMVASAGIGVVLLSLVDTSASGLAFFRWKEIALAAVILVLTRWVPATKKLHPIVFIGAAALVGVLLKF